MWSITFYFLELVCVSGGEEQHFTCTEFRDNLRVLVSGNAGAARLVPVGCTEWARLCHLQVCVQGQPEAGSVLLSLVTALWQWLCWSKWATVFSSIFVLAGMIPWFVLWTHCQAGLWGAAQGDTSALLCQAPGAASGCNCQENSSLMHPSPEQSCFTGRSCLGGVWGGFYCWLGLSSSCSAGLSVSM